MVIESNPGVETFLYDTGIIILLLQRLIVPIEQGDGADAGEELGEEVGLVRGVDGVAFETEAHQERVDAEDVLEVGENRDAAAAAGRDRLRAVDLGHGAGCGLIGL